MCRRTTTPASQSTPTRYLGARDPGNRAALELLRRAGEQARLLRQRRAPFEPESAADAVRNREMVAGNANASAWRHRPGERAARPARRPAREMSPGERQRLLERLAHYREGHRRRREADRLWAD
jgi:hypothetical protein